MSMSAASAVGGSLQKTSGKIIYTVTLNIGSRTLDAQNNNTLCFEFSRDDVSLISCVDSNSTPVRVGTGPLTAALQSGGGLVTCKFYALLNETEKAAAQVNPIKVKAKVNGSSTTRQYFILEISTDPVPIGYITAPVGAGLFNAASGSSYYSGGECLVGLCVTSETVTPNGFDLM